jgi:hypothetical protein
MDNEPQEILAMNNPPVSDDDRWMLLRKPALDAEILRQVALLSDDKLPRLRLLGAVYVNLEDIALNKISSESVLLEVESQDINELQQRSTDLNMVIVMTFRWLYSEFGVADYCDLNCDNPIGCCLEAVWASARDVLLSHIAGYVIRANPVQVVLAEIYESQVGTARLPGAKLLIN